MLLGKDVVSNLLQLCGDDSKSCELETILGKEIENKQAFSTIRAQNEIVMSAAQTARLMLLLWVMQKKKFCFH